MDVSENFTTEINFQNTTTPPQKSNQKDKIRSIELLIQKEGDIERLTCSLRYIAEFLYDEEVEKKKILDKEGMKKIKLMVSDTLPHIGGKITKNTIVSFGAFLFRIGDFETVGAPSIGGEINKENRQGYLTSEG